MSIKNDKRLIFAIIAIFGILLTHLFYNNITAFSLPIIMLIFILGILIFKWGNEIKFSILQCILSILIGLFWVISTYNGAPHLNSFIVKLIAALAALGTFSLCFYFLISELSKPFSKKETKVKKYMIFIYMIPTLAVWSLFFLAYFPAKMTFDSFWQWSMAHGIKAYNAWHPVLHTWWIELTTKVFDSPASYIVSQMVVVSLIIGYAMYVLVKLGVPRWVTLVITTVFALYPINGFYMITMWKDIPFAAFILLITVIFAQIIQTNGKWLDYKRNIALFIAASFVMMNLRNNGYLALVLAFIVFIVFVKESRKRMIILALVTIVLRTIFTGPVMDYFNVIENPLNQALAVPSQQIAAVYKYDGDFTPELKSYFDRILPAEKWKSNYNPYTVDPLKHDPQYNSKVIEEDFNLYLKNWAKLLKMNFSIYVKAYADHISSIWQFHSPADYRAYVGTTANLEDYKLGLRIMAPSSTHDLPKEEMLQAAYNAYKKEAESNNKKNIMSYEEYEKQALESASSLETTPKSTSLKQFFDKLFEWLRTDMQSYFAKGAIPLLLLFVGLAAAFMRFKFKGLAVYAPVLFILLSIAVAMPATDFRYSYSFVLSIPFLFLYGKLSGSKEEQI